MTVLTQALAFLLRSNFFLIFFMGVFLEYPLGDEDSETPGYSPCFQCSFLPEEEEESLVVVVGTANAQRKVTQLGFWVLGLRALGLGLFVWEWERGYRSREEEKERYFEAIGFWVFGFLVAKWFLVRERFCWRV